MATNEAGSKARTLYTQQVSYLRKTVTFADNGKSVVVGRLPIRGLILKPLSGVSVNVAFNGATTNTVDIGTSADADLYGTDLALGAVAFVPLDEAVSMLMPGETIITADVVSTTGATAGEAEIVIAFIADDDG